MKNDAYKVDEGMSTSQKLSYWLSTKFLVEKMNNPIGYFILLVSSVLITFAITKVGHVYGSIFLVLLVGGAISLACLFNTEFGFFFTTFFSFFVFEIKLIFGDQLPIGAVIEVVLFITFIGIFLRRETKAGAWKNANNPITYVFLITIIYTFIQVFNPEMHSVRGWLFVIRKLAGFSMAYFIVAYIFSLDFLKRYLKLWLFLALLAAVYACYQEWIGLPDFEENWIRQDEKRFGLYFIDGRFRKASFITDPSAFGILMAASGLLSLIMATSIIKSSKRILLVLISVIMFLGMAYSGTRTAYAMVPAGLTVFILMTITHKRTLIIATSFLILIAVVMFGPIYGNATVNRIRSTLELSEDPSLNVRNMNRARIQPYLYEHPIGGGVATTGILGMKYNPRHVLAGFPPDSGYLRTALETGWVGLAITCILYFTILYVGVRSYYRSKDPQFKVYYAALVAMIYALIVAQYAQVAIGQLPGALLFYPALAIIGCLYKHDRSIEKQ